MMHPTLSRIRHVVSRSFFVIGVVFLAWCFLILVFTWATAAREGMIPEHWGEYQGNHGPWRHYAKGAVMNAILSPFFAGCAALVSVIVKPSKSAGGLLAISVVAFVLIVVTHFWLID